MFSAPAINKLTNAALDLFAKIPEFKYCAIRVTWRRELHKQSRGQRWPTRPPYGQTQHSPTWPVCARSASMTACHRRLTRYEGLVACLHGMLQNLVAH